MLIAAELDAEHIAQLQLAEAVEVKPVAGIPVDSRAGDGAANLADYLALVTENPGRRRRSEAMGLPIAQDIREPLTTLLGASFPEMGKEKTRGLIERHIPDR